MSLLHIFNYIIYLHLCTVWPYCWFIKSNPMTQINSYLTFSGNCREAMEFYASCLGGELTIQTIGESPLADKMPAQMKNCILHSALTKDALLLLGTDCVPESGLVKGNSVSLALNCSGEEEIRNFYTRLSAGGAATHPLEETFWGALFGDLTDKYGNHWLLNYTRGQKQ
jgi:PhnB protein